MKEKQAKEIALKGPKNKHAASKQAKAPIQAALPPDSAGKKVFHFVYAKFFFEQYAPQVKDWMKKCTGKNGRGNPLTFSEEDVKAIRAGLKQQAKDLQEMPLN